MELTTVYRSAPGCCMVCKTSGPGPVVDLDVPDQGERVRLFRSYLCGDCARQVARLILSASDQVAVPAMDLEEREVRLFEVLQRLDAATARAERAEALLAGLREAAFS